MGSFGILSVCGFIVLYIFETVSTKSNETINRDSKKASKTHFDKKVEFNELL